jgi:hypothetical protein
MEINMKSIHNKLLIIQKSVDKFVQDGQAHGYKYTTGSTVLNKIRPLMNEHKLLLNQEVTNIVNNRMDYTLKNGNSKSEILTTLEIRFTWVDCESGETLVSHFAANGQNDWDKGLGSALTYAERYYLLKFFHIPTDEDDVDAKAPQATTAQPDLPWLNKDTQGFNQAVQHLKQGGTIADIRKKFKVSKETEQLLTAAAK